MPKFVQGSSYTRRDILGVKKDKKRIEEYCQHKKKGLLTNNISNITTNMSI